MNEAKAKEALAEIGAVSSRLVTRPGSSFDDAIAVASALIQAAEQIFLHIGGPTLAAAQFQHVADRHLDTLGHAATVPGDPHPP